MQPLDQRRRRLGAEELRRRAHGAQHTLVVGDAKVDGVARQPARGPLGESQLLDLIKSHGGFDGLLCGDDHITARVIDAALPRLKVISKYGIGLDSIDVNHATARRLAVLFTPGVNERAVAEHTIGVMIALFLQKLAVGLVGFFVGGAAMAMVLGIEAERWYRVGAGQGLALLLAAIAGAVLAAWLFDLALIAGTAQAKNATVVSRTVVVANVTASCGRTP